MPERVFNHGLPPQRIRTFLVLFALALTLPLIGLAVLAFNQLAGLDEEETERRVVQVAQSLVDDIDRELDRATITLETLATSTALAQDDFAAFHEQASRAPGELWSGSSPSTGVYRASGQPITRSSHSATRASEAGR